MATVVDTLQGQSVIRVDVVVESQGVALALTGHVVLAFLRFHHDYFTFFVDVIFKLHIVRSYWCVLIGDSGHHS